MKKSKDKSKWLKIAVLICVPLLIALIYHFRVPILWIGSFMGKCQFHEITGYHCPGCGNTRAVTALFKLKPLTALRNNPLIPILCLFGLGGYIELAADVCGKKIKLVPRNPWVWLGLLIVLLIFYVVRNFFPILAPIPPAAA